MELVPNEEKYWEFIRELRIHRDIISGFVDQVQITPEQQRSYMAKHGNCYYVCLESENPVGWVGVVDDDIRVAVHPEHKGRGIGRFMINELMNLYPNAKAKVLLANEDSRNLFLTCGFVEYTRDEQFIHFKK
jgi:GNAT superfamily N-acetyltransferase